MKRTHRISRILVADQSFLFRRGISALISNNPILQLAGEAGTSGEILSQIRRGKPDVLVVESCFLSGSSDDAFLTRALRQEQPGLRILVLAQQDSGESLSAAIAAGAKGFVLKNSAPAQLLAAVLSVAFGEGGMNESGLLPEFKALADQTPANDNAFALTAREQEVMKLLAEGKTVRLVARELALSTKTVEAHKLNLMRKLDIHDRASLIAYANRSGMVAASQAR